MAKRRSRLDFPDSMRLDSSQIEDRRGRPAPTVSRKAMRSGDDFIQDMHSRRQSDELVKTVGTAAAVARRGKEKLRGETAAARAIRKKWGL